MKKKILLIMMFGFILFGCGDISKIRVLSVGKPYAVTIEDLCNKQHYMDEKTCSNMAYYDFNGIYFESNNTNKLLKKELIAAPIETNFSMVQNAGYELRECSFIEEITQNSKYGFDITVHQFGKWDQDDNKGYFVLNIDKVKKLGWLDKDNLLTKSVCVSPRFGSKYYQEKHEIDPVALKNALDEIGAHIGVK